MAVVPSVADVKNVVLKTLNWIKLGMVPVGTIQTGLYTAPPAGYLAFKRTDQILKSQYPALVEMLFKINNFKGNGSTYANIPNVDHRVIELASNVQEVGQLMEAGLPDIAGEFRGYGSGSTNNDESGKWYGAISIKRSVPNKQVELVSSVMYSNQDFSFLASKSNALFGKAFVNQMASLRLIAIIKA